MFIMYVYLQITITADNQFANAKSVLEYSLNRMRKKRGNPPDKWE